MSTGELVNRPCTADAGVDASADGFYGVATLCTPTHMGEDEAEEEIEDIFKVRAIIPRRIGE